jgi:hypothetical protein
MIALSHLVDRYQKDLESIHGHEMLPSHHQALRAMRRCRREGSDHMVLECQPCATTIRIPHSCGHRSCPHCQHHDSQQWIQRQTAKLLPVSYFMITFTVPAQLRSTFWQHQKQMYDLLIKASWQTIDSFARRDPKLKGRIGAHAVLHTHNRKLEYHPHLHMIVPAGAVDEKKSQWRCKTDHYLFPVTYLAKETLENPGHLRDNGVVVAGQDWGDGRQAARFLGLRAHHRQEADQTREVSL